MQLWRVVITDRKDETKQKTYRGEAEDVGTKSAYEVAADKAVILAFKDGFKKPWVDTVSFVGEKVF